MLNKEFVSKIESISDSDKTVFSVGHNTFFTYDDNKTVIRYVTDKGVAELSLGTIEELCEGNAPFESTDEDWMDIYLPLLMAIESAINRSHKDDPNLRDKDLFPVLERLIMKPDINLNSKVVIAIQENIKLILATNMYSLKEVKGSLKKVLRSVRNHHAVDGPKGYLDFIRGKV
jgi:hypothetical protein